MKAEEFKECNVKVAKDQEQYLTLPAYRVRDEQGSMITCYGLTIWERIKLLFRGKVWMHEMTFNQNVTPRSFSVNKWDFLNKEYFKNKQK